MFGSHPDINLSLLFFVKKNESISMLLCECHARRTIKWHLKGGHFRLHGPWRTPWVIFMGIRYTRLLVSVGSQCWGTKLRLHFTRTPWTCREPVNVNTEREQWTCDIDWEPFVWWAIYCVIMFRGHYATEHPTVAVYPPYPWPQKYTPQWQFMTSEFQFQALVYRWV